MKHYIRLARPHHWMKNVLVLLPLICSGELADPELLRKAILAFFAFSFLASSVYIINDIRDREKDRLHTTKRNRPIASGAISVSAAWVFCGVLLAVSACLAVFAAGTDIRAWTILAAYFVLNLAYSFYLKSIPLVDIAILASGFLLRLLLGSVVCEIVLSKWLCLSIIAVSFYMGLGKRRGELKQQSEEQRAVLKYYTLGFLEKNMYMSVALAIIFYSLWTVDSLTVARAGSENLVWTVPLVILCCMRYSLDVEGDSDGDPVEVLLHDKALLILGVVLCAAICMVIYL